MLIRPEIFRRIRHRPRTVCPYNGQPHVVGAARCPENGLETWPDVGRRLPKSSQRGKRSWRNLTQRPFPGRWRAGWAAARLSPSPTPRGIRDAAIISLLYGCGLRRAELVALDLVHYTKEESELRIRGKGNKQWAVPLGNAALALADRLDIRGGKEGPLFWGLGNRNQGHRLTDQAVYTMLRKRAKEASVKNLSPTIFVAPSWAICWTPVPTL